MSIDDEFRRDDSLWCPPLKQETPTKTPNAHRAARAAVGGTFLAGSTAAINQID
jgi:hypothetical protein